MATEIKGLASLKRKLAGFPAKAREEISWAMEISAQEIVDLARSLAPVDSGALRDSIGWSWHGAPAGSMVLGQVRATGRGAGNLSIVIYAGNDRAYYARWVEFGTRARRAHPFFFPAYRAVRKRVRGRVSRAIAKAARSSAAHQA